MIQIFGVMIDMKPCHLQTSAKIAGLPCIASWNRGGLLFFITK
jgi:hypothetical protein